MGENPIAFNWFGAWALLIPGGIQSFRVGLLIT